jgi:hypothetical protein
VKLLKQLWALAERESELTGVDADYVFHPIGLALQRPLATWDYNATPVNSSTFASTGGDGVHFGLLFVNGIVADESSVVMTVPMMGNVVLGANLHEFLCLGCQYGYSSLEDLVYDPSETINLIMNPESWMNKEAEEFSDYFNKQQYILKLLTQEFDLKPWVNVEARLAELQTQYMPLLQLRDEE